MIGLHPDHRLIRATYLVVLVVAVLSVANVTVLINFDIYASCF
jgi:hypothetical protein